ncbi:LuxR C-terminal-related transcriptional regulator [Methylogaea oryzae]|uniref:LuxR C-terminal-related transcriptional regulator n=1 Tax=Methylogaea oryzae TaxID=1295382 RepID=UPI001C7F3089|nr:response regulator transcription factor [Methylogaea oryzae]
MNILLIDDHFCAREGVALLLQQMLPDAQVFEAHSVETGLAIGGTTRLNLALLDVQLPGKNGLEGLAELKAAFPDLCVVMFSGLEDRELVFEALRLGAMGFIPKSLSRQEFAAALQDVLAGRPYLPASAVAGGSSGLPVPGARWVADPRELGLTPREFEVLRWLVQGKGNKDIAKRLGVSEQTVKNHLRPIFHKFGVARRAELVVKVFERGIVLGAPEVGN